MLFRSLEHAAWCDPHCEGGKCRRDLSAVPTSKSAASEWETVKIPHLFVRFRLGAVARPIGGISFYKLSKQYIRKSSGERRGESCFKVKFRSCGGQERRLVGWGGGSRFRGLPFKCFWFLKYIPCPRCHGETCGFFLIRAPKRKRGFHVVNRFRKMKISFYFP